jgi:alpha-tubulin suppressor-like RCC1 family protein
MPLTRFFRALALVPCAALLGCETVIPVDTFALGRRLLVNEQAACALDQTGAVYCWGANSTFQEFGAPASVIASSPTPIGAPVPRLSSFASGVGNHFCGIDDDAALICWGRGTFGQLGRGDLGDVGNAAAPVSGDIEWREATVGRITTCGLARDATAYCWGTNQRGEIGVDTVGIAVSTGEPRKVVNGDVRFGRIATGWRHACGIATTGQTFCWGHNSVGELGNGVADSLARRVPTLVAGGHAFVEIVASARHTCAIDDAGAAWCWGNNQFGQLGDGSTTDRHVPTRVSGTIRFTRIITASGFATVGNVTVPNARAQGGVAHTCALAEAGGAFCWGWNGNGQLGDGSTTTRLTPVAVTGGLAFDEIGAGGTYTCGRRGNGVWCWGASLAGQLGSGAVLPRSAPTPVAPPFDRP